MHCVWGAEKMKSLCYKSRFTKWIWSVCNVCASLLTKNTLLKSHSQEILTMATWLNDWKLGINESQVCEVTEKTNKTMITVGQWFCSWIKMLNWHYKNSKTETENGQHRLLQNKCVVQESRQKIVRTEQIIEQDLSVCNIHCTNL